MKVRILFVRFPFGGSEHPSSTNWYVETMIAAKADPRIETAYGIEIDDTPITMSRNRALKFAKEKKFDYCVMLDSDMAPDLYGAVAGHRKFWPAALDFALAHHGPCVIGVPYCGPPPHENIYVFRWANQQSDHPNIDLRLEQYTREEAAVRGGFEEVAALPTGLCLIDMRALESLAPDKPWFDYEYEDKEETKKSTTEDVFFTRNLSLAGVPQYCFWDAWAGHIKRKVVGKPILATCDGVRDEFRAALARPPRDKKLIMVNEGAGPKEAASPKERQSQPASANGVGHVRTSSSLRRAIDIARARAADEEENLLQAKFRAILEEELENKFEGTRQEHLRESQLTQSNGIEDDHDVCSNE